MTEPPAIRIAGRPPFVDAEGIQLEGGPPGPFLPDLAPDRFGGIGQEGLDDALAGSTSQGSGADQVDPGSGGGGPARFCFEWDGLKWGRDYASVYGCCKFIADYKPTTQWPTWRDWACAHEAWWACLTGSSGGGSGDRTCYCPSGAQSFEVCPGGGPPPIETALGIAISGAGPGAKIKAGKLTVAAGASLIALTKQAELVAVTETVTHGLVRIAQRTTFWHDTDEVTTPSWDVPDALDFDGVIDDVTFNHIVRARAVGGRQVAVKTYEVARDLRRHRRSKPYGCGQWFLVGPYQSEGMWKMVPFGYIVAGAYYWLPTQRGTKITRAEMRLILTDATGVIVATRKYVWSNPTKLHIFAVIGKRHMTLEGDAAGLEDEYAVLTPLLGADLSTWELRVVDATVWIDGVPCQLPNKNTDFDDMALGWKGDTSRYIAAGAFNHQVFEYGFPTAQVTP